MNLYPLSSLFFYRLIFTAWLLLGEVMFLIHMKRKNRFLLRVIVALVVCFGFALAFPIPFGNAFYSMIMFFSIFIVSYLMLLFCFRTDWKTLLFVALCGYTTEHIGYEVYQGIFNLINASTNSAVTGLYNNDTLLLFSSPVEMAVYFSSYVVIYWLVFILCGIKVNGEEGSGVNKGLTLGLGGLFLVIDIVFSSVISFYSTIHYDGYYLCFLSLINVACCIAALFGLFQLFYKNSITKNLEVVNELRREEQAQYEINKQTIDLINTKCHDLKYQIRQMGNQTSLAPEVVESMAKAISIYDSSMKTGNNALDIVLTQKSLFCNQHHIKFNCIADGAALSFISEPDTYSLFGNIIDNAIEAIKNIDSQKRLITLRIKKKGDLVSVSSQNWYEGEINFKDGFPVTKKEDARYHGFGLKSIGIICEKYHGSLSMDASNHTFTISILFTHPEPNEKKEA